jgi:aromatic-L-amino-acid decarboxylase
MSDPSPLDLDHATMQRMGRRVADLVASHLASLREQRVHSGLSRPQAERLLAQPPPVEGGDFEALLGVLTERVFPYAVREPHPGFIAYVPSCPTFPAVLGDWLATGYNFFAGAWPVAAGPSQLELVVIDWFRRWLGLPEGAGGLLTTGGSAATLTAVIAARHRAIGDDPGRIARLRLYASEHAHSSVTRAAWLAGLARAHVRSLPVDAEFRLRVEALSEAIRRDRAEGGEPLMVVASAGTTNTGAVDPLPAIADVCEQERVWLHVDAAYGGFAALTERGARALEGMGRADTVTVDPHKWLFVPFECGGLLAREPRRLKEAFQIFPDYLADVRGGLEEVNFADYGEQLTRYARALKVWLSVSYFGTRAIASAIDRGMDLAALAERLIRETPGLEVLSAARFGVCCFRARPAGAADPHALDALNGRVLARVNEAARYHLSTTRLDGALALRICILGFRTTADDVRGLVRELAEATAAEAATG